MCNMCTRDAIPPAEVPEGKMEKLTVLEGMKRKHNLQTNPHDEHKQKEVEYQPDLLALYTQHSKVAFDYLKYGIERLQETKPIVWATRTPQLLHVALASLVLLGWLMRPGGTDTRVWRALYVGSVSIHLGAQVWMTLISGVVLFFSLPRHEFGRVQTVLFPIYYLFNSIVSLLALTAYCRIQFITKFQNASIIQFSLLLIIFLIEAFVRLYMVKPMLKAKHLKTQMEEAAGGGQEIGKLVLGELAHCPRYLRILKRFRRFHSTIAMGTMITLGCNLYIAMILVDSVCGM